MKRSNWAGLVAMGLLSVTALGCSDDPTPPPTPGTGGMPATGGSGTGGTGNAPPTGVQLAGAAAYTILSGANAAPATAAAPTGYTTTGACVACHASNGEGIDGLAPEIRHAPTAYATWMVRNGRSGTSMSAFPATSLSDADLTAIITWLGGMPKPTTPDGLYKDFCGNCHGPTGGGGAVPVKITGLPTATVDLYVRGGNGAPQGARNEYMPAFDVALLTEAEFAQIKTFLGTTP
jgi:mono/diheme cytochrome c family protein